MIPIDEQFKGMTEVFNSVADKALNVAKFRAEASRKAALANKRVKRLEKNGLKDSPAYKRYLADGGGKFGVAGKTYNEVQKEVARLNRFIDSQTSTVRGAHKVLKEMASNTGIKYKSIKELRQKSSKFFELASKTEQYLRNVEDMASAIGYQQIWEAINEYTTASGKGLDSAEDDIDSMVYSLTQALKNYDEPTELPSGGWYKLSDN